jgi:hypothetical protein
LVLGSISAGRKRGPDLLEDAEQLALPYLGLAAGRNLGNKAYVVADEPV